MEISSSLQDPDQTSTWISVQKSENTSNISSTQASTSRSHLSTARRNSTRTGKMLCKVRRNLYSCKMFQWRSKGNCPYIHLSSVPLTTAYTISPFQNSWSTIMYHKRINCWWRFFFCDREKLQHLHQESRVNSKTSSSWLTRRSLTSGTLMCHHVVTQTNIHSAEVFTSFHPTTIPCTVWI